MLIRILVLCHLLTAVIDEFLTVNAVQTCVNLDAAHPWSLQEDKSLADDELLENKTRDHAAQWPLNVAPQGTAWCREPRAVNPLMSFANVARSRSRFSKTASPARAKSMTKGSASKRRKSKKKSSKKKQKPTSTTTSKPSSSDGGEQKSSPDTGGNDALITSLMQQQATNSKFAAASAMMQTMQPMSMFNQMGYGTGGGFPSMLMNFGQPAQPVVEQEEKEDENEGEEEEDESEGEWEKEENESKEEGEKKEVKELSGRKENTTSAAPAESSPQQQHNLLKMFAKISQHKNEDAKQHTN